MEFTSKEHANKIIELCIGKIFKMLSRPNPGNDVSEYEKTKQIFFDACEYLGMRDNIFNSKNFTELYNR